jgi:CheY-like chemotaxis protein
MQVKSVLVVDDHEEPRSPVADVLRDAGYITVSVSDRYGALKVMRTLKFDAMVLDLATPELDGAALLGGLTMPPPVVDVSGWDLDAESRQKLGRTVVAQLPKPVDPKELLAALARAFKPRPPPESTSREPR